MLLVTIAQMIHELGLRLEMNTAFCAGETADDGFFDEQRLAIFGIYDSCTDQEREIEVNDVVLCMYHINMSPRCQ